MIRRSPIKRRSYIRRSTKPIRRGVRPRRRRLGRQASVRREADRLWSLLVKKEGVCICVGDFDPGSDKVHICRGALQAMHGIPRTYAATRWLPINGFPGCQGVHWYYTVRKEEWTAYLVDAWGLPVFEELWDKARSHAKPDMDAVVDALRRELGGTA